MRMQCIESQKLIFLIALGMKLRVFLLVVSHYFYFDLMDMPILVRVSKRCLNESNLSKEKRLLIFYVVESNILFSKNKPDRLK